MTHGSAGTKLASVAPAEPGGALATACTRNWISALATDPNASMTALRALSFPQVLMWL